MKRLYLSQIEPIGIEDSSFPVFARFYSSEGNLLRYKDGAIPFFIKISNFADNKDILSVKNSIINENRRLAKGFMFEKFTVYEISDYSYQSMSPTFDDATFFIYKEDGYKLPEKEMVLIKNYTLKKAYILFPKNIHSTNVNIVIEPSHKIIKQFFLENELTFEDRKTTFKLDTYKLNSIDNVQLYVKEESGLEYYLPRSSYSFKIVKSEELENNVEHTFIEKQGSYFLDKTLNTKNKVYSQYEITLNNDFIDTNLEIYIVPNEYYQEFYYGGITTSRRIQLQSGLKTYPQYDVFKREVTGMVKMVQGIDYYIDGNEIKFIVSDTSIVVEVYLKKDPKLVIPFETGATFSFTPQRALYDNHISKWNVDIENSFVTIFENGLFKGNQNYELVGSKTYEYVIEDVTYINNTLSSPEENIGISPIPILISIITQNKITYELADNIQVQKYQITTDPDFNTLEVPLSVQNQNNANIQEVYLYDTGLNFKLDVSEPYITNNSGLLTIQGITDPYPSFLDGIEENYEDFQSIFESEKTKLTKTLHDNADVIETQISQLKKNFKAILSNSSITYQDYTAQILNAGKFLFLVIKGTPEQRFNIIYKEGTTIIKKEYGCTIGSDGVFISIPFFLDTFVSGGKSTIDFEIEPIGTLTSPQYHIFK